MKLQAFSWSGMTPAGQKLTGRAYELHADLLRRRLTLQGLCSITIKRHRQLMYSIRYKDVTYFIRQLAIMLKAGLPLLKALETFSNSAGVMQAVVLSIQKEIEQGKTIAESLRKFPKQFDSLFCNLVQVGETAGILDVVLWQLVEYREKIHRLKSALFKALSYPVMVLLIAFMVTLGLLIFIVPQFQSLFAQFNAPLPFFTEWIINLSKVLKYDGIETLFIFSIACGSMTVLIRRSLKCRRYYDSGLLRLPLIGNLLQMSALLKISRTLSVMLKAGLSLSQALTLLLPVISNAEYKIAMTKSLTAIKQGQAFYIALQHTNRFPDLLIQMVQVGEESGTLDTMLYKAADLYQEELDHEVAILKELIEPVMMSVLGVIVGGLVIAMYLPVFNLGGVI